MRCLSCNIVLNDFESTRRYANTGEFVDMCKRCFNSSDTEGVDVLDREDLKAEESVTEMEADEAEGDSFLDSCGGCQCH